MKKPICYQDDRVSCGSACIQMILLFFKRKVELKDIKKYCKSTDNGTTVYGIIKCLEHYQIDAKAYHASSTIVEENYHYPCIAHLLVQELYHYVVIYGWKKDHVIIGDPAKGIVKISRKDFEMLYQGVVIQVEEVGIPLEQESYQSMCDFYIRHFLIYRLELIKITVGSIVLMIGNIFVSYYFQIYIDYLLETKFLIFLGISLIFLFVHGMKLVMQYYHQVCLEYMHKQNNEVYILNTMQTMLYLQPSDIKRQKEGVLINKVKGIASITSFISKVYTVLFVDSILIIGIVFMLFMTDVYLGLMLILFMGCIGCVSYLLLERIQDSNRKNIEQDDQVNNVFLEGCKNLLMIQQYSYRTFFKEKLQHYYLSSQYYELMKHKNIYRLQLIIESLSQLFIYFFMFYCYVLYLNKQITLGSILFLYMLIGYCIEPILRFVSLFLELRQQTILFTRYKDLLPSKKTKKKRIKRIESIECNYITYSYDYHHTIFSKFDLLINNSIILEGENGSGKTTLLNLIMGYDMVDRGEILINGINIKDIDIQSYYHRIIYLSKNPVFFHESVIFNIIGYEDNKRKEVERILAYFNSNDIIERLDHLMEEDSFSSGQLQLIMFVRAIVRKPDVLLLDEAISNIDEERVCKIFNYIDKELKNTIIIMVSHHTKLVNLDYKCVIINKI